MYDDNIQLMTELRGETSFTFLNDKTMLYKQHFTSGFLKLSHDVTITNIF